MTLNKEYIIVGMIFIIALFYISRRIYNSFSAKKDSCEGGCGCAAADLKKKDFKKI